MLTARRIDLPTRFAQFALNVRATPSRGSAHVIDAIPSL
jgi:hypothetical protein